MMSKQELLDHLTNNKKVVIEFTKKDGSNRRMVCTRNMDLIPEAAHPKKTDAPKPAKDPLASEFIHVYDVEAQGWRSVYPNTITSFEVAA